MGQMKILFIFLSNSWELILEGPEPLFYVFCPSVTPAVLAGSAVRGADE